MNEEGYSIDIGGGLKKVWKKYQVEYLTNLLVEDTLKDRWRDQLKTTIPELANEEHEGKTMLQCDKIFKKLRALGNMQVGMSSSNAKILWMATQNLEMLLLVHPSLQLHLIFRALS